MKKLVLTAAILMGFVMGSYAQHSLFQNNNKDNQNQAGLFSRTQLDFNKMTDDGSPFLPNHGFNLNADADQEPEAPLGGGALLLIGFGAAYAMSKRNKKD
jgi:hypothetical protein